MSCQEEAPSAAAAAPEASVAPVLLGRTQGPGIQGGGDKRCAGLADGQGGCGQPEGQEASAVVRGGTLLERAGTQLERAGSNLQLQRADTLPTDDKELRHAATMPIMFDLEADRPWCWGLWKTQQLAGFLLGIVVALIFCLARPSTSYPVANDMLAITAVCAFFWVFEVIPVYITALLPLVLMPFFKVTSSAIAAQAYWNWVSMLVVGTFLVDIALEEVHLPRRLALQLLLKVGVVHPSALLACFMALCWFLAMFVNSIAVTLLITPFAISLMNAAEEQVRSLAADASSEAVESGIGDTSPADAERSPERDPTRAVQMFSDCLLLGVAYSATCGGIATITGAIPNYFLAGGSLVAGRISWSSWFAFALPISIVTVVLAYVVLYLRYVRGSKFYGLEREVLEAEYEDLLKEVGPFSRDELMVGAMQLLQTTLLIIRPFALSPLVQTDYGEGLLNDATLACLPAILLFFIPSVTRPGQAVLTWPAVHEKFDFGLLLLIGGALAINSGFTQSGLNVAMGDSLASFIPHVSSVLLHFLIIVSVTLASQVFSSIGTAAAILPALGAAAEEAVVNPLGLMLPAVVATSFAFILPTATPPNVVVLAKSQLLPRPLRIRDFFSNGLALTVFACVAGAVLTQLMGAAVFDSAAPFPKWACTASAGSCMWVEAPGVVEGRHVDAQACIVNLAKDDGAFCRLWNGTVLNTTLYQPLV